MLLRVKTAKIQRLPMEWRGAARVTPMRSQVVKKARLSVEPMRAARWALRLRSPKLGSRMGTARGLRMDALANPLRIPPVAMGALTVKRRRIGSMFQVVPPVRGKMLATFWLSTRQTRSLLWAWGGSSRACRRAARGSLA